ncbi:NAD(P)-dependent oxidoreductase [Gymnodinialimonas ceratoperidinii]|uniref:NAD(P)-dependent oxidoreductase n=1 Tax=Gymnodinialimonas ceratoperidinii TaxID=2856823 RepID=A0A8F6Y9S5_9RHOB|nr:NAD(P)-dependent oxidoreductase [Gymnodinialimonas ceratoperidinii]QXT38196.1 NAD(P)-dependent oxidoreductase [Gymnodinialimonas ceratoperidinii]
MRVGVVGLGQMGGGIARCLDRAGQLHAARDSKPDQRRVAGLSEGVSDDIDACDVLLFVVPSTTQVADVMAEIDTHDGQIIVDLTTSHPDQSKALAETLRPRGLAYVDAAMTGGAAGADAGKLTLMMGGDAEVIAQIAPVLDIISAQRFHLGEVGAGHAMKLVHNLILHSAFLATCEGLTLAEKAGLDVARAVDVLNAGNARSFVTEVRFPRDILGGVMNGRSVISNLEKDLGLARRFADALGGPSVYTDLTHDVLRTATDGGDGGTDFSYLFPMFEGLAKEARGE